MQETMKTFHPDIQLVFFSSKTDGHCRKITDSIPGLIPRDQILCHSSLNDFSRCVGKILYGHGIIVILVRDGRELNNILTLKACLQQHKSIILILPDADTALMQESARLYPRYTSYIKNDYHDIFLVLEKMIIKMKKRIKGEENGSGN